MPPTTPEIAGGILSSSTFLTTLYKVIAVSFLVFALDYFLPWKLLENDDAKQL